MLVTLAGEDEESDFRFAALHPLHHPGAEVIRQLLRTAQAADDVLVRSSATYT
jgi:hypothetical protein